MPSPNKSLDQLAREFYEAYLASGGAGSTVDVTDRLARILGRVIGSGIGNSVAPTPVAAGAQADLWTDLYGRLLIGLHNSELNSTVNQTILRDLQVAQRYPVIGDSIADGLSPIWTLSSNGSGSNPSVAVGEGTINPGLGASGSSQMVSTVTRYLPGQMSWLNSAVRLGDTGVAGNTRRWGPFTVAGTTPQDGFCYELADTTLNACVFRNGSLLNATPVGSWSKFATDPFTPTANYTQWEVRWTSNTAWFYINNILRHVYSSPTQSITATLNFPMTLQSVNNSGLASGGQLFVRNIGIGRFGNPPWEYTNGTVLADQNGANAVLTFTFPSPVDLVWVTDIGAVTTNISRCDPYGGTPTASLGAPVLNQVPTPIQVLPPSNTVKVWAPTGAVINMRGDRYV